MEFSTNEIVLLVLVVALAGLLALFGNTLLKMAKDARDSLPAGFQDFIRYNAPMIEKHANEATQKLVDAASGTANKFDDEAAAFIRRVVLETIQEFNDNKPRIDQG